MSRQKIKRELGVKAIIVGRVLELSDNLVITAEMIDTLDGTQLWGEQYRRKSADIFEVQEEISKEISEQLRLKLTGTDKKRLNKRHTQNLEAYHLYLKGRFHCNKRTKEGLMNGAGYFQQAIDVDPSYALAYSGLADAYALCADFHSVNDTLEQAQENKANHILGLLDPRPGERILDLGCGWGAMLQRVFEATNDRDSLLGYTLSKEQVTYVKERLGFNVSLTNFITTTYAEESLDKIYSRRLGTC